MANVAWHCMDVHGAPCEALIASEALLTLTLTLAASLISVGLPSPLPYAIVTATLPTPLTQPLLPGSLGTNSSLGPDLLSTSLGPSLKRALRHSRTLALVLGLALP